MPSPPKPPAPPSHSPEGARVNQGVSARPKRTVSVVTGCLNEVGNIEEFCRQVRSALDQIP
jgi:hypothetical protein